MYSSMAKGTTRAEVTSNSEEIRSVALVIVELQKSEGISQASRQAVENSIKYFFKYCYNFLKAFRINLKAFLGSVLPNQYCHIRYVRNFGWF